jgi:hypothetical protein
LTDSESERARLVLNPPDGTAQPDDDGDDDDGDLAHVHVNVYLPALAHASPDHLATAVDPPSSPGDICSSPDLATPRAPPKTESSRAPVSFSRARFFAVLGRLFHPP